MGLRFARQREQKGTGHALASCRSAIPDAIPGEDGLLMVLYGDTPLLSAATLTRLRDLQAESGAAATLITTRLPDPTGYGRVILDESGGVRAIVEEKACTPEQRAIRISSIPASIVSASDLLWKHIGEIEPNNPAREYYLTDMAEILSRHGYRVRPMHVEDASELLGINTRIELADADRILRQRKADELMLAGVTIERPERSPSMHRCKSAPIPSSSPSRACWAPPKSARIAAIGAGSILESSILADRVVIKPYSVIADSRIETGRAGRPVCALADERANCRRRSRRKFCRS